MEEFDSDQNDAPSDDESELDSTELEADSSDPNELEAQGMNLVFGRCI